MPTLAAGQDFYFKMAFERLAAWTFDDNAITTNFKDIRNVPQ
jgi:hypothetical protein